MKDASTNTDDLESVIPKLVDDLIKQDDIIEDLKKRLYQTQHKMKFKKTLDSIKIYFIYTLPWIHFYEQDYKTRFYKTSLSLSNMLFNITQSQLDFIYSVYCNPDFDLCLDIFYFVNLFENNIFF